MDKLLVVHVPIGAIPEDAEKQRKKIKRELVKLWGESVYVVPTNKQEYLFEDFEKTVLTFETETEK